MHSLVISFIPEKPLFDKYLILSHNVRTKLILGKNMTQADPKSAAFVRANCELAKRLLDCSPTASGEEKHKAWAVFLNPLERQNPYIFCRIADYLRRHYDGDANLEDTKAALDTLAKRAEEIEKIFSRYHDGEISFDRCVKLIRPLMLEF